MTVLKLHAPSLVFLLCALLFSLGISGDWFVAIALAVLALAVYAQAKEAIKEMSRRVDRRA